MMQISIHKQKNTFLYNTFSETDPRTVSNYHSEASKGNEYHEIHYIPSTDMTRVFRDVLKYVHKNNEYIEGSLLNRSITTTTTTTHFIKKQIFTISIVPTQRCCGSFNAISLLES